MVTAARPVGLSSLELLVTGSVAGVVAKTVTAPLDRVRLIYQAGTVLH